MKTKRYLGLVAKEANPTQKHRPAIWECMLGTVYALNDKGEVKYFDYDHEGAKEWAGIDDSRDLRLKRYMQTRWFQFAWPHYPQPEPSGRTLVLWIKKLEEADEI